MKVRVVLTVEVDPQLWEDAYGTERSEVRDDVKAYIVEQINGSAAGDECNLFATLA